MIMDERTEFCDATALNTGGAGSYLIGDVYDTGGDGVNIADGLYLVIIVTTQVDSAADGASVQFHLASDAAAAIATDGSATYHFSTDAIAEATLAPGYRVCAVRLPHGTYERYIGILQTTSGEAVTAGAVDAFLTTDVSQWKAFPNAANAAIV